MFEVGQTVTYGGSRYVIVAWRSKGTDIGDFYDLVAEDAYRRGERRASVSRVAETQIGSGDV